MLHTTLLLLHLLAAMAWVGGMAFAVLCLRPAAAATLPPPQRLPLWREALSRFLRVVGVSIAVLLATGVALWWPVGLRGAPPGWHAMATLGLLMTAVYARIRVTLLPQLAASCAAEDWPAAAQAMERIRRLVLLNLALGVATAAAALAAR